jgi:hypothetical protein
MRSLILVTQPLKRRRPEMQKRMSWFDWFVTGSFWLMGLVMAFGIIIIALRG